MMQIAALPVRSWIFNVHLTVGVMRFVSLGRNVMFVSSYCLGPQGPFLWFLCPPPPPGWNVTLPMSCREIYASTYTNTFYCAKWPLTDRWPPVVTVSKLIPLVSLFSTSVSSLSVGISPTVLNAQSPARKKGWCVHFTGMTCVGTSKNIRFMVPIILKYNIVNIRFYCNLYIMSLGEKNWPVCLPKGLWGNTGQKDTDLILMDILTK